MDNHDKFILLVNVPGLLVFKSKKPPPCHIFWKDKTTTIWLDLAPFAAILRVVCYLAALEIIKVNVHVIYVSMIVNTQMALVFVCCSIVTNK